MGTENELHLLQAQLKHQELLWQKDTMRRQVKEALLEVEVLQLKHSLFDSEQNGKKELDLLKRRVKMADNLLSYLKSKAQLMAIPRFAHTSCGIKRQEGIGFVDKRGIPMAEWRKFMNSSEMELSFMKDRNLEATPDEKQGCQDQGDGEYIERIARAVMQVTDVMEVLLKRAMIAEAEVDVERETAKTSQDEVKRKTLQLEGIWGRVEEMEKVAVGTSGVLKEMQTKLEDMEQETSRQRQRAAENEQELTKVKHDFGVLKSSIDNFVTTRETITALEKQLRDMQTVSERLNAHVISLEASKRQKEAEVRDLLSENDQLREKLDFKEAELAAMCDRVKFILTEPKKPGNGNL